MSATKSPTEKKARPARGLKTIGAQKTKGRGRKLKEEVDETIDKVAPIAPLVPVSKPLAPLGPQVAPLGPPLAPVAPLGAPIAPQPQEIKLEPSKPKAPAFLPITKKFGLTCPIWESKGVPTLAKPDAAPTITKKESDQILTETSKKQQKLPALTITKSSISLYSWEDIQKIAPVKITDPQLTGNGSVNDNRLGLVSPIMPCHYCGQIDCPGHFGRIEFGVEIYNPAYIREIVCVLMSVCNDCGGLLIPEDVIKKQGFNRKSYDTRLSALENYCKQDLICLRQKPQVAGGPVRPCNKNPTFITLELADKGEITYKLSQSGNKRANKDDQVHLMHISVVSDILNRISEHDARLLGFPKGSHPRNMIMKGILVPPVIARPPNYEGGTLHHEQLSHMFINILRKVIEFHSKYKDKQQLNATEIYSSVKQLIFKTDGKKMGMREFLSIVERIQGKSALLRNLLMGKRNNHCGRTVIGPDPSLRFGQIRIPEIWAEHLIKKETVTHFNRERLEELKAAGRITHIITKKTGLRKFYHPKAHRGYHLQIGDIVERWLQNGDRVVVNRQPSLHKQSMMGYEVVLGPQLTIGFHLSYTTPKNADFDGDESNAWNPQDFEVESEVEILMNVKNNIMSSEQNKPIMGLVMNSVSGCFLLTRPDTRVRDSLFEELIGLISDKKAISTLYSRLMKYGVHPRSGYALFSSLLPSDFYYEQGSVLIIEGIMISGQLKKSHIGTTHRSIVQELSKQYGSERTSTFLTEAPWIINKWLIERGFSVGLSDCISLRKDEKGNEYDANDRVRSQELAKIYVELEALGTKSDDPVEEAFRQRQINNQVNIANGIGLRLAKEILSGKNSIGVMTDQGAGTKGGIANIGQMVGSVGQQFYRGERLPAKLTGGTRLLPSYDINDQNPEANAFIPSSFFAGIGPEGLFFLQAGGRENLLDTALKTSETGAMQHKMIKAFENIVIGQDGSIRNTIGTLFATIYNSGYDISQLIKVENKSMENFSSFIDIKNLVSELNVKRGWVPKSVAAGVNSRKSNVEQFNETILNTTTSPAKKLTITPPVKLNQLNVPSIPKMKLTKYEKARIVGTRAMQLSNDAVPLIDIGTETDPVKIALNEYELGLLKIESIRKFTDGDYIKVQPTVDNI